MMQLNSMMQPLHGFRGGRGTGRDGSYRTQAVTAAHEKLRSREFVHYLPRPTKEGIPLAGWIETGQAMAILKG
jgi:hypothetical protein